MTSMASGSDHGIAAAVPCWKNISGWSPLLDSTDDLVLNRESTLVELVGILEADEHASFEGALSGLGLVWVGYGSVTFGAKLY